MFVINYANMLRSDNGKLIISIIIGLGLAALFHQACKDRNCVIITAPSIQQVHGNIFKHKGKCYKFKSKEAKCTNKEHMVMENDQIKSDTNY